jgi:hypothetical protein
LHGLPGPSGTFFRLRNRAGYFTTRSLSISVRRRTVQLRCALSRARNTTISRPQSPRGTRSPLWTYKLDQLSVRISGPDSIEWRRGAEIRRTIAGGRRTQPGSSVAGCA